MNPNYPKVTACMIRSFDDPILKQVCVPGRGMGVVANLRSAMRQLKGKAVGLAAPQIGHAVRIIIIQPNRFSLPLVMINPEIIEHSPQREFGREGCLSYPGIFCQVERNFSVRVKWRQIVGGVSGLEEVERLFTGFEARVIQHEIDHLDGICRVGDAWRASVAAGGAAAAGAAGAEKAS